MHFVKQTNTPIFPNKFFFSLLVMIAFPLAAIFPAHAAKRALVIGNDAYDEVTPLKRAVSDAWAVGDSLEKLGFFVSRHANLRRRDFSVSLKNFVESLDEDDEVVFFFAGHGISIKSENFLLPTDIPNEGPSGEVFIRNESFGLSDVLEAVRSKKVRVSVLIVDACRNNPFKKEGTRTLGASRGLTSVLAPEGTFILYSAGVGQMALDSLGPEDSSKNSVFVRSLVPLMETPGLSLPQIARRVRRDVDKLAKRVSHEQRPAYYDELLGDVYLAGLPAPSTQPAVQPLAKPTAPETKAPETKNVFRTIPWERSLSGFSPNGLISAEDGSLYITAPATGTKIIPGQTGKFLAWHGVLIRLNADGSEIGRTLLNYEEHNGLSGVIFLKDGSIGSAGYQTPKGHFSGSFAFHRFNTSGKLIDEHVFSNEGANEGASVLAQLSNGTIVLAGYTRPNGSISMGGKLVAIDENGKVQWSRAFGQNPNVSINAITALPEGGLVIFGGLGNPSKTAWGARLTSDGQVLWQKEFKSASVARDLIYSTDGNLYVVGTANSQRTASEDLWIAKITLDGSLAVEKTFGADGEEKGFALTEGPSNLYIAGSTTSKGAGTTDVWLLQLNKYTQLSLQRDKTIGGARGEIPGEITLMPDGGLVVTGLSDTKGGWAFAVSPDTETRKLKISGGITGPCVRGRNWAAHIDPNTKGVAYVGHYYCEAEESEPFFEFRCRPESTSLNTRATVNFASRFMDKSLPVKITVDRKQYSFRAQGELNHMADTHEVVFEIPFTHPLVEALAAGSSAVVSAGGASTKLHLKGSRAALDRLQLCSSYASAHNAN